MKKLYFILSVLLFGFAMCQKAPQQSDVSYSGTDAETGLAIDEHLNLVKANCTNCHSAKMITMNRFNRAGWEEKIRWMQKTQNLWQLGDAEPKILDYLAKHYAPEEQVSRRKNLENIEWYELK